MTRTTNEHQHGVSRAVVTVLLAVLAAAMVGLVLLVREPRPKTTKQPVSKPPSKENLRLRLSRPASQQAGAATAPARPTVNPDGYTSARVCGACHVDIYESWRNSLHAFSVSDPVFDAAFMQAIREGGDEAKRVCLRCHAPITQINDDIDLKQGVTAEGVACDFCHTITAVDMGNREKPFTVELGLVKRGVLKRASSPAHQVAYSSLHESAELCGGCHNYTTADGVHLMSTYQEWLEGPYAAEGKPCQSCHMRRRSGDVVAADVRSTEREGFHQHDLIHDTDQLRSAVSVEVERVKRTPDDVSVDVVIANVGSGHKVPTGIPSRQLVLTVTVSAKGHQVSQERRYHKVVADASGRRLALDYEALLHGTQVIFDNRLGPRERRVEHFSLAPPGEGALTVTAAVSYVYSPMVMDQRLIDIELARAERAVP